MLKSISPQKDISEIAVPIGQADFPLPFKSTLEYNAPAHGLWNIVHTGMLIPDSVQIFICPANCMRGVVLTAAEMNEKERFLQVLIEEKDVLTGNLERLTIEGVADCLNKLPRLPKAALIFTVCIHHFMGADLNWIYKELKRRFPEVTFIRCFMDPIMRKSGLTPDQKMRQSLYEPIQPLPVKPKTAAILGSDFALDESSDIKILLKEYGWDLKELPLCRTYEEYLSIGKCALFISVYPPAKAGALALARRLNRPHLYLPLTFDFDEIKESRNELVRALTASNPFERRGPFFGNKLNAMDFEVQNALKSLKKEVKDTPIAIDYTFCPRPIGLARLLLEGGFNVSRIYLDTVSAEEEKDFYYLKENFPSLLLLPTVDPKCRVIRESSKTAIALGQKAAYFLGSMHFANVVEGAGWQGTGAVLSVIQAIKEALETEKDPRDYITQKGLGCESCIL